MDNGVAARRVIPLRHALFIIATLRIQGDEFFAFTPYNKKTSAFYAGGWVDILYYLRSWVLLISIFYLTSICGKEIEAIKVCHDTTVEIKI